MAGRPSKYDEGKLKDVVKFCKLGATDKELADFLDITESTLNEWKKKYPQFSESLKKGKILADANVASALYKRAVGFKHKAIKIFQHNGKTIEHEYMEYFPPDAVSCFFWLKNRQSDRWRDKPLGELGLTDNDIQSLKKLAQSDTQNNI